MTYNSNPSGFIRWIRILSWGLYDLANQFFALNIISLYFVRWVTIEKNTPEIFYSIAFGVSTCLVAVSAPVLGVISDISQRRRIFLVLLTMLSVSFTVALHWIDRVIVGLLFFAIANFGCQAAIIFYNALMLTVAPVKRIGLVSGIGRMLGYCGAIIALYLLKPLVLKYGYHSTFLPTGLLFLFFSLPCMVFVKDLQPGKFCFSGFISRKMIVQIFSRLKSIAFNYEEFPGLCNFLRGSFFCLCGVNAVILFMSVYVTRVFNLSENQIVNITTFSTFFAILGSVISGFISDYIGHKRCLVGVLVLRII